MVPNSTLQFSSALICCFFYFISLTAQTAQTAHVNLPNTFNLLEDTSSDLLGIANFSVEATPQAVEIFWENPFEADIAGYEIQRSFDGTPFETIKWVELAGDQNYGGAYLQLDESLFINQTVLYRIKSVAKDGRFIFSDVKILDLNESLSVLVLEPSQTFQPNWFTVEKVQLTDDTKVRVYNAAGKQLLTHLFHYDLGSIDLNDLPDGRYFVKILNGEEEVLVKKVIKIDNQ